VTNLGYCLNQIGESNGWGWEAVGDRYQKDQEHFSGPLYAISSIIEGAIADVADAMNYLESPPTQGDAVALQ
jgi:hypothetical protein